MYPGCDAAGRGGAGVDVRRGVRGLSLHSGQRAAGGAVAGLPEAAAAEPSRGLCGCPCTRQEAALRRG